MTDHLSAPTIYIVVVCITLGVAAWRDLATRTVPDGISIAIALAGVAARLAEGGYAAGVSALTAIGLFVCLLPLNARGLLGGADVKLLTALSLGLAPLATLHLLTTIASFGAVLAIFYLTLGAIFRRLPVPRCRIAHGQSLLGRLITIEHYRIRKAIPLPYCLAIAAGSVFFAVGQSWV